MVHAAIVHKATFYKKMHNVKTIGADQDICSVL